MKRARKSLTLGLGLLILAAAAYGCSYNELPPKTDDVTTDYVLPQGEIPTAEEYAEVEAIRTEYRNSTGQ